MKEDIERLQVRGLQPAMCLIVAVISFLRFQAKFTKHYAEKRGEILTPTFDIPPVSANIIWIRQIERQLSLYMQRVASVLGTGWENHVEGQYFSCYGIVNHARLFVIVAHLIRLVPVLATLGVLIVRCQVLRLELN